MLSTTLVQDTVDLLVRYPESVKSCPIAERLATYPCFREMYNLYYDAYASGVSSVCGACLT